MRFEGRDGEVVRDDGTLAGDRIAAAEITVRAFRPGWLHKASVTPHLIACVETEREMSLLDTPRAKVAARSVELQAEVQRPIERATRSRPRGYRCH